jgi:exodeoxyribonuclease VII small subunit
VSELEPDYAAMTFEQLVQELETLTNRMAAGTTGIEQAADDYERAGRVHALAAERLARIQKRIEAMSGATEGSATTEGREE